MRVPSRRWIPASSARRWRPLALATGSLALLSACAPLSPAAVNQASQATPATHRAHPQTAVHQASALPDANVTWKLRWSLNFNTTADLQPWNYVVGGNGFSLKQLQWYDASGATINKGNLDITARRGGGGHECWYGRCKYRSVRMNTLGLFEQTYGRFEARIKLPPGRGLWPAFWLEGADIGTAGWPAAGEIDVVETDSKHPNLVSAYAHAPGHHKDAYTELSKPVSAGYHVFGVDWTPKGITWFIDGRTYASMKAYKGWPFSHKFFMILDLAVGGGFSGPPNAKTPWPAHMLVDWIRVYRAVS
jgi:beta-glucanase (GH16 family)